MLQSFNTKIPAMTIIKRRWGIQDRSEKRRAASTLYQLASGSAHHSRGSPPVLWGTGLANQVQINGR